MGVPMLSKFTAALVALLSAVALLLGSVAFAPAAAAGEVLSGPRNSVENSGLSNANLLVCGTGGQCVTLLPGQVAYQSTYWNPTQIAVGANQSILYRVLKDDYEGPWGGLQGGSTGTWLSAQNLQNFFGGGCRVQVIMDDPR